MIDFSTFDSTSKIILAVLGLLIALRKIVESFASQKRKEELKIDLEILEKLRFQKLDSIDITKKIERNIENTYKDISENFLNFFLGLTVFLGFGKWTIDLIVFKANFNPWSILTCSLASIGLSMLLSSTNNIDSDNEKEDKTFAIYEFKDRPGFIIGLSLMVLFGILSFVLIYIFKILNHWTFVCILTSIIGFVAFIQCIKRVK